MYIKDNLEIIRELYKNYKSFSEDLTEESFRVAKDSCLKL